MKADYSSDNLDRESTILAAQNLERADRARGKLRDVTWTVLIVLGLVLLGVTRSSIAPRSSGSYQGKGLYYWMLQNVSCSLEDNPGLMAIGTNAVPDLARVLQMSPTYCDRSALLRNPTVHSTLTKLGFGMKWTYAAVDIRAHAAYSLGSFAAQARPALQALHAALIDPSTDDGTRLAVVWTLRGIGPLPDSLPYLLNAWPIATNGGSWLLRRDLLYAIIDLSTNSPERCLPIFLNELNVPNDDVRYAAAWGLSGLGHFASAAVPALEGMLLSTNSGCQFAAALALGNVTNSIQAALPRLHGLELGADARAAAGAALTLWRWGQPVEKSVGLLTILLEQREGKCVAAAYLAEIGTDAKSAVPALLKASQEDIGAWVDRYDRATCALSALRIGGPSDVAVTELENALTFPSNPWVRYTVARDLGRQGALAQALLPALRRSMQDPCPEVRRQSAIALKKIQPGLPETP